MKNKLNNYKEKKKLLNEEKRVIYMKIERLKKKIKRRNTKIEKIDDKLLKTCKHKWVPDLANYNIYDRPKICEICELTRM